MSSDLDDLPPLDEALATVEPELIYYEAKRQYEAFMRPQASLDDNATPLVSSRRLTRQHTDLSLHYRNLFENAIKHLDELRKLRLLHICFAYKTKTRVLRFLDLLDEDAFEWVRSLKQIVTEYARDSAFEHEVSTDREEYEELQEAGQALGQTPLEAFRKQYVIKKVRALPPPYPSGSGCALPTHMPSPDIDVGHTGHRVCSPKKAAVAKAMPTKQPGPYFVIPTLPIAFPSQFFSALASYVPITHLTVASMLSYPSAYLLAVSSGLKGVLRSKLPNFWKDQGPVDAEEEALWTTFFDHLLRGREMLIMRNGAELPVDEGDGYGHMDLEMWIAGWLAERQMKGMREKGLEEKARIRSSMGEIAAAGDEIEEGEDGDAEMDESDGEDESEDEDEVAGEESEQEAEDRDEVEAMDLMPEHEDPTLHLGNDTTLLDLEHLDTIHVGQGRTGPRRVSWNEGELASFFEIPARPTKKGKVRANR